MNGMSGIFRPEVLAAFMQQVIDEPVLPILYMSTVRLDLGQSSVLRLICS